MAAIATILALHAALLAYLAMTQSPNIDEVAHLAAGTTIWRHRSFELYCVNPPLVRAWASWPAAIVSDDAWLSNADVPVLRPEFAYGTSFVEANPTSWFQGLVAGRLLLIPLSIAGATFCYLWAAALFGRGAGYLALLLWCFSPSVLAWSSVIGTDAPAASFGVGACYCFWAWLQQPVWRRAGATGILLGLAELTKFTWIVLFVVWPLIWLICRLANPRVCHPTAQLLAILAIALSVLNIGYLYEGTFNTGRSLAFHSQLFQGIMSSNRGASSFLSELPIPLPTDYLRGLDLQQLDFETGRPSFLMGQWSNAGWPSYYLVAAAVKVPCGVLMLIVLAFALDVLRRRNTDPPRFLIDRASLLAPVVVIVLVAVSKPGVQQFRYLLPVLPLLFVWCGVVMAAAAPRKVQVSAVLFCCWALVSSLTNYPHMLSYFNEIAGGPVRGHRWLGDTSLSWSQDHFRLRDWLRDHTEIETPYMTLEWSVPLSSLGLYGNGPVPGFIPGSDQVGPIPGQGDCTRSQVPQRTSRR